MLREYLKDREAPEERIVSDLHISEDKTVQRMLDLYSDWLKEGQRDSWRSVAKVRITLDWDQAYWCAKWALEDLLQEVVYDATQVRTFSALISAFQDKERFSLSGVFLSALVELGDEQEYELVTAHLDDPLDWLGYMNIKDMTILGDAGDYLGFAMQAGSVRLLGDAGENVGECMQSGSLWMKGDYACIGSQREGGSIYHKGVLIEVKPDE